VAATTEVTQEDLPYVERGDGPLLARVYRPTRSRGPLPALVDVHGGAWRSFDRSADTNFDRALAASGMVVVALDFRMAPAHRWPASLEDVREGICFVRANAARLGALPDPIGLIGGSSGGQLALVAAIAPGSPGARVAYALPLWPIADPFARYRYAKARIGEERGDGDRFFAPERLARAQEEHFGDEETMRRASVPRMLDDGEFEQLPPLWVAHPELDQNVTLAMTQDWVAKYRARGGEVELEVFAGVGHSFANFPGPAADRCIAGMRDFVARQLAPHGLGLSPSS
jgi:acetyl esterase/lipase